MGQEQGNSVPDLLLHYITALVIPTTMLVNFITTLSIATGSVVIMITSYVIERETYVRIRGESAHGITPVI